MNKQTKSLFLVLVLLMSIFSSACQTGEVEVAADEVKVVETDTAVTMADRIRFQDKLWQQALSGNEAVGKKPETNADVTIAERIRFQDRLWGERPLVNGGLSQASRIHFHDRLWENQR